MIWKTVFRLIAAKHTRILEQKYFNIKNNIRIYDVFFHWCFRMDVWLWQKMFPIFQFCQNDLTITNSIWFFVQISVYERNSSNKKRSLKFYEFSKNCRHACRRSRYNHEFFRFTLNKHCCQLFFITRRNLKSKFDRKLKNYVNTLNEKHN